MFPRDGEPRTIRDNDVADVSGRPHARIASFHFLLYRMSESRSRYRALKKRDEQSVFHLAMVAESRTSAKWPVEVRHDRLKCWGKRTYVVSS